ncbi:hypothetical protein CLAIMM_15124 [Cladophialophora immunda]|nr:hypothetical protein CLAIMM_15124 [Cladophialophora immunda]
MPVTKPLVLLTGLNGFVGARVLDLLLKNNYRVRVKRLRKTFPSRPLFGMGFSLGANIIANYLGEEGSDCPLKRLANIQDHAVDTRLSADVGQQVVHISDECVDEGLDVGQGVVDSADGDQIVHCVERSLANYNHDLYIHIITPSCRGVSPETKSSQAMSEYGS